MWKTLTHSQEDKQKQFLIEIYNMSESTDLVVCGPRQESDQGAGVGSVLAGLAAATAVTKGVVGAIGFGSAGIAKGSLAAAAMSASAIANSGGVASGGVVATLQSLGAASFGTAALKVAGVAAGVAVLGAAQGD